MIYNSGVSFGLWPKLFWPSLIAVILLVLLFGLIRSTNRWSQAGYVLVIAAGVSNLIDRLALGAVRDFIHYPFINTVGNLADIFIVVGTILILKPKS